ncbi:MAG: hypothetical protein SFU84_03345 [Gemmatimonadales bacterium]|nr:hypothetical protein [Gemmatimonadales bacterium]
MRRALLWLALAVGVLMSPTTVAEILRQSGDPPSAALVFGLWLFKGLVVGHVVAAWLLGRHLAQPSRSETPPSDGRMRRAVGALLLVGLVLRLPGLNGGLWYDEIQTLMDYVLQPWGVLLTTFDSTNQHLLYSAVAHVTTQVMGATAAGLRLPAVLFGVLSLWAAVAFARRWMPSSQAWWSAVVLAVSYHHVWFSQNARGYTGLLLGTLVGSTLFLELLRGRPATAGRVWGYGWVMALTVTTHVTALVVVAAHGLCWLWQARHLARGTPRWAPFAALVVSGSLAVMLYAPVLPQLFAAVTTSGTAVAGVEWQSPGWFIAEAVAGLVRGVPAGAVVVPVAGLVVLAGLAEVARRDRVVTAMMLLPMVLMAVLLVFTGHNLWPRFFFFGAGFVVQWAVHGGFVVLERLIPRFATRIASSGLAVVSLASLFLLPRAWAPKQDYPAAAAWVREHSAPEDVVLGTEMMALPMNTWLGNTWPIVMNATELEAAESARGATWLLYTFPIRVQSTMPDLWRTIQERYEVAHVVPASIGGGELVIMRRPPSAPAPTNRE